MCGCGVPWAQKCACARLVPGNLHAARVSRIHPRGTRGLCRRRESKGATSGPCCCSSRTGRQVITLNGYQLRLNRRWGPARGLSCLVGWVGVTYNTRLRVVEVDADDHRELASALDVSVIPTLVLLKGRKILGRLDGRVTGNDITRLIRPFVGTGSRAQA